MPGPFGAIEFERERADFALSDLTLVMIANDGFSHVPAEAAVPASRRLVAYLLQAFRTGAGELPPPVALSPEQALLRTV